MFKGADNCIIRLSLAKYYDQYVSNAVPGMALKMLREEKESANFLARLGSD